jgi:two-component system sensor histidine kinase KdpD
VSHALPGSSARRPTRGWIVAGYPQAVAAVAFATGLSWLMFPFFELANLIMTYLLAIVAIAARYGRGPSVVASVASVAAFDFFFVPPYFTFVVADTQYLLTFVVMLIVGLVISGLTARIRRHAEAARQRSERTAALYAMSRELASTRGVDALVQIALRHIGEVFHCQAAALVPGDGGTLAAWSGSQFGVDANDLGVARWVFEHRQPAGRGTATLPGASALYVPMLASSGAIGVVGVRVPAGHELDSPERLHQLETFAAQTALALERTRLAEDAQAAQVRVETERLRNSLLSSVSHDLRTPLATITGAVSTILEGGGRLDAQTQRELLESVHEEAERLNRLVQNLLEMTRLESGALQLRKEMHPPEEVIGAALARLGQRLAGRRVTTRVPPDLPLVAMDDVLIEQVLLNLLDNALKFSPADARVSVRGKLDGHAVEVVVSDHGHGIAPEDQPRIFDRFHQVGDVLSRERAGAGLGLYITKRLVEVMGGSIDVDSSLGAGSTFRVRIPVGVLAAEPAGAASTLSAPTRPGAA